VPELFAIAALDTRPVLRLVTLEGSDVKHRKRWVVNYLTRKMSVLVAVTALDASHVARLGTIARLVTLLTTIVASTTATALGTVAAEVAHCKNVRQKEIKKRKGKERNLLSPHLRHSTPSAERGSVHSRD
jgi:hypothetical protein